MDTYDSQIVGDFKLFQEGLFYPFWRRWGFLPPFVSSSLRVLSICMVAWFPILVLSFWEGTVSSGVHIPFFHDFEAQIRLLVALPILLTAEEHAGRVSSSIIAIFLESGIVRPEDRPKFHQIITSVGRWNRSPVVSIILLGFILLIGHQIWQDGFRIRTGIWYGEQTDSAMVLTSAGFWYVWCAIPIFQFVLYRWYLRMVLWWVLLWKISRLNLCLIAAHPDRSAGLGFLGNRIYAFIPFIFAQGVTVSGIILNQIIYKGHHIKEFGQQVPLYAVMCIFWVLGPLMAFSRSLLLTKRRGQVEYNLLAFKYVDQFERKWIRGESPTGEELLGTQDIQSLSDLGNGAEIIRSMRTTPFGKTEILKVGVAFALPIAPLLLTMFPAEKIVVELLKMIS
jgi:hypothetical protein